jgi:hypothetical protein
MREIAMTSWLGKKADTPSEAAAEATKRIHAIRTGADRRDWAPTEPLSVGESGICQSSEAR